MFNYNVKEYIDGWIHVLENPALNAFPGENRRGFFVLQEGHLE
jgi:hypothetical protein